jgi:hypothetical protein
MTGYTRRGALPGLSALAMAGPQPDHARMDEAGRPGAGGEFTALGRAEWLRLLGRAPVGRLIFTVNALPAVRPINFALVDGLILVHCRRLDRGPQGERRHRGVSGR